MIPYVKLQGIQNMKDKNFNLPLFTSAGPNNFGLIYLHKGRPPEADDIHFAEKNNKTSSLIEIHDEIDINMSCFHYYFISLVAGDKKLNNDNIQVKIPDFNMIFGILTDVFDKDETVNDSIRISIDFNHKSCDDIRHSLSVYFDKDEIINALPRSRCKQSSYKEALSKINLLIKEYIYPWYPKNTSGVITVNYHVKDNRKENTDEFSLEIDGEIYLIKPVLLIDSNHNPEIIIKRDINSSRKRFESNYLLIIEKTYHFLSEKHELLARYSRENCRWVFQYSNYEESYFKDNSTIISFGENSQVMKFIPHRYDSWVRAYYINNLKPAITDEISTNEFIKSSDYSYVYGKLQETFYKNLPLEEYINTFHDVNLSLFTSYEAVSNRIEFINNNANFSEIKLWKSKDNKYLVTMKSDRHQTQARLALSANLTEFIGFNETDYFEEVK
jgi:hypothetical protein